MDDKIFTRPKTKEGLPSEAFGEGGDGQDRQTIGRAQEHALAGSFTIKY